MHLLQDIWQMKLLESWAACEYPGTEEREMDF